eukprot:scaffold211580_cov13-Tisochrysis_lutea.AAC.1
MALPLTFATYGFAFNLCDIWLCLLQDHSCLPHAFHHPCVALSQSRLPENHVPWLRFMKCFIGGRDCLWCAAFVGDGHDAGGEGQYWAAEVREVLQEFGAAGV